MITWVHVGRLIKRESEADNKRGDVYKRQMMMSPKKTIDLCGHVEFFFEN